jgi:hypothetical protein
MEAAMLESGKRYKFSDAGGAGGEPNEHVHIWVDQAGRKLPAAPERHAVQPIAGGVEEEVFADGRRRVRRTGVTRRPARNSAPSFFCRKAAGVLSRSAGRWTNTKVGDALADLESARSRRAEAEGLRQFQALNASFWGARRPI